MTWPVADPFADLGHGRLDEVRGRPVLPDAGDPHHEVAQHVPPDRRVHHLGVELDAVQVAGRIGQAGERRGVGLGDRPEPGRRPQDRVAVAHPDRLHAVDPGEQPIASVTLTVAGPYSRFVEDTTSPPSSWAISCSP